MKEFERSERQDNFPGSASAHNILNTPVFGVSMEYEACGVSEDSDRSVWGVSVDRRIQGVSMDRRVRVHARIQKDLPEGVQI